MKRPGPKPVQTQGMECAGETILLHFGDANALFRGFIGPTMTERGDVMLHLTQEIRI